MAISLTDFVTKINDGTLPSTAHGGTVGGKLTTVACTRVRPAGTPSIIALDTIGPSLVVSGATNATPIVMTTGTHSLADGDYVTQAAVGGNTAAIGSFYVDVLSATTYALYSNAALTTPVAGNGAYTSGGTVAVLWRWPALARVAGGSGYITRARLMTDLKTMVARVRLHLFHTPVAAILDDSPYLKLYANRASRLGEIDFPTLATEDSSNSTAASALLVPGQGNLPLAISFASGVQDIWGMAEVRDAFTGAAAQGLYIELTLEAY